MDLRNEPGDERRDSRIVRSLEKRAVERHGRGITSDTNIRQRLFDADGTALPAHDKNEIEVAIAHLVNLPTVLSAAQHDADLRQGSDEGRDTLSIEDAVC